MTAKSAFVLDAELARNLGSFQRFCRSRVDSGGIAKPDLPFQGLNHLARCGTTFVLPNEVLKELTQTLPEPIGLKLNQGPNGLNPRLDIAALKYTHKDKSNRSEATPFLTYLLACEQDHLVRYYASPAKYLKAAHEGIPTGVIAVVAGLGGLPRMQERLKRELPEDAAERRDQEMRSICEAFEQDANPIPYCLLTDRDPVYAHGIKANLAELVEMLAASSETGFQSLPAMLEQYRENPQVPRARVQPVHDDFPSRRDQFMAEGDLLPHPVVGEIDYHQPVQLQSGSQHARINPQPDSAIRGG